MLFVTAMIVSEGEIETQGAGMLIWSGTFNESGYNHVSMPAPLIQ